MAEIAAAAASAAGEGTEIVALNPRFGATAIDSAGESYLSAVGVMDPASKSLQMQKWQDAIPNEQKALQHLLRAEATFRQIEVAFGAQGGGGASSGG